MLDLNDRKGFEGLVEMRFATMVTCSLEIKKDTYRSGARTWKDGKMCVESMNALSRWEGHSGRNLSSVDA